MRRMWDYCVENAVLFDISISIPIQPLGRFAQEVFCLTLLLSTPKKGGSFS